jgi:hypothetical protein
MKSKNVRVHIAVLAGVLSLVSVVTVSAQQPSMAPATAPAPPAPPAPTAAVQAADAFIKLFYSGAYTAAYNTTAPRFQQAITVDQWNQAIAQQAPMLGTVTSRKMTTATLQRDPQQNANFAS